jgi:hypothetical protein
MKVFQILVLMVAGCGPTILPEDSDADATADTGSSTEAPPPSSTSTTTSTSTSTTTSTSTSTGNSTMTGEATFSDPDSTDEGVVFLLRPDGGGSSCHLCCDIWAQDCPEGTKCMPDSNEGTDVVDGVRCSGLAQDPGALGEPCTVEGWVASGIDDCDYGLMCWHVDPDTLQGTCVALCMGDEANPICDGVTDCLVSNGNDLPLCLPPCDPLVGGACPEGDACVPSHHEFVCAPTGTASPPGGSCPLDQVPYGCEPGSVCVGSEIVGPPCDETMSGCCTPYCDLSQPDPTASCLDPGQICVPWHDTPLPGLEDVGICALL